LEKRPLEEAPLTMFDVVALAVDMPSSDEVTFDKKCDFFWLKLSIEIKF
jgi:hypothetical protein